MGSWLKRRCLNGQSGMRLPDNRCEDILQGASKVKRQIQIGVGCTAAVVSGQPELSTHFGIREVKKRLNDFGALQLSVNGKDILIRGAAWTPDILLSQSRKQDSVDIQYLKNMNLNAIRLEGYLASDNFWDLCDIEGILVMAGWSCGCHWFNFKNWKPGDLNMAIESLRSQIYRLRKHPSLLLWLNGSDNQPLKQVEREYIKVLAELELDIPYINAAAQRVSEITGNSGVKMTGPYCYVPPSYWYDDEMVGRAKGFNAETCPDASIPPYESLKRMFSPEQLFIGSESWLFHAGMQGFKGTALMENPIKVRYEQLKALDRLYFLIGAVIIRIYTA